MFTDNYVEKKASDTHSHPSILLSDWLPASVKIVSPTALSDHTGLYKAVIRPKIGLDSPLNIIILIALLSLVAFPL